jgi:hypothetical protein
MEARQATTRGRQPVESPRTYRIRLRTRVLKDWASKFIEEKTTWFQRSNRGNIIKQLDQALPQDHMLRVYKSMNRSSVAILVQLRTGVCGLNQSLYQRRLIDSPRCGCGADQETIEHFLCECHLWTSQRQALLGIVGCRQGDISYILGGWKRVIDTRTGKNKDGPMAKWRPNIEVLRAVVKFVQDTARLVWVRTEG